MNGGLSDIPVEALPSQSLQPSASTSGNNVVNPEGQFNVTLTPPTPAVLPSTSCAEGAPSALAEPSGGNPDAAAMNVSDYE